jgi:hypothetical protein
MNPDTGAIRPMTEAGMSAYAVSDRLPTGEVAVSAKVARLIKQGHWAHAKRKRQMAKASRKINRG